MFRKLGGAHAADSRYHVGSRSIIQRCSRHDRPGGRRSKHSTLTSKNSCSHPAPIPPSPQKSPRCARDWLAQWMPNLTCEETPLSPYRVIWDLQHTVDKANVIITHDAGSPRDQLSPFWISTEPLSYIGWGKTIQLGYGLRLAIGAKLSHPGSASTCGRCGNRIYRYGLRDCGGGADSNSVDPAKQLLHGD
jgi:hypothetical protein